MRFSTGILIGLLVASLFSPCERHEPDEDDLLPQIYDANVRR